jgi:hypothetical protein
VGALTKIRSLLRTELLSFILHLLVTGRVTIREFQFTLLVVNFFEFYLNQNMLTEEQFVESWAVGISRRLFDNTLSTEDDIYLRMRCEDDRQC